MDLKLLSIKEHEQLLNCLGYTIDLPIEELLEKDEDGYKKANIYYKNNCVGDIGFEERNLYYLYRDDRVVGNKDLSTINFSKRKQKNIRTLMHIRLHHNDLKINCFNMLHSINRTDSEERNFISISDINNVIIYKYLDEESIGIMSLNEDIQGEELLKMLRKSKDNKTLTYKLEGVILDEYKN